MSSRAREAEKRAQREREQVALDAERRRKEDLSMYWRIEEADANTDVKDILHRIAEHLGLEP